MASQTVGIRDRRQGGSANDSAGGPLVELSRQTHVMGRTGGRRGGGGHRGHGPPLAREGGVILPTGPTFDVNAPPLT